MPSPAPPVNVSQIDAWLTLIKDGRTRRQTRTGLLRMRNQLQVLDAQVRVLTLINGNHSLSTIRDVLRVLARVAPFCPDTGFMNAPQDALYSFSRQRDYPQPMPQWNKTWPSRGESRWSTCTNQSRRHDQAVLAKVRAPGCRTATNTEQEAIDLARAYNIPPDQPDFGDAVVHDLKVPEADDWNKFFLAHHRHKYNFPALRHMIGFVIHVLRVDPDRLPGLIRADLRHVKLSPADGRPRIEIPPGPYNKRTINIFLDKLAASAASAWLEFHPFKHRCQRDCQNCKPLLVSIRHANKGVELRVDERYVLNHLRRRGTEAGVPIRGSRAFRIHKSSELGVQGVSAARINRRFNKNPQSSSHDGYVRFPSTNVVRLMRRIKGLPDLHGGTPCPKCKAPLEPGAATCTTPSCKKPEPRSDLEAKLRELDEYLRQHED